MNVQVFKKGFKVEDFNKFCHTHIVVQTNALDNGMVYVFYKDIGIAKIDQIEALDKIISTSQVQILTSQIDIEVAEKKIADLEAKTAEGAEKTPENEAEIRQQKRQILMAEATIAERDIQMVAAFNALAKLNV